MKLLALRLPGGLARLPWGWVGTLLLLLPLSGWAQPTGRDRMPVVPRRLDSQQAWLRRPYLPDTTRVKLLITCSILHMETHLDSARLACEQALQLARQRHFTWGEAYALLNLGAIYYYSSDYPAAQRTFEAALRKTRQVGQNDLIGHAYLGLGNVANELRNNAASQHYYAQAQRYYATYRPRFVGGEQLVIYNQANSYLEDRQLGLARSLVQQGLALLRQYPKAGKVTKFQLELGTIQLLQHHSDSAAATWQQVIKLSRAGHDVPTEGEAWQHLAELARQQQQFPMALAHARRAAGLFRSVGTSDLLAQALDVEAAALAALHRPEAYDTLRRYVSLRDTLLSQQRLEAIANAQARFEQAEQRARIRALEQQRRIVRLEDEQRAVRSHLQLGGLAGVGLLLGGGAIGLYRRRQQRREAALRNQLAADLHDDVGSLLSQIALQTDLLQEGLGAPEQLHLQWAEVAGNSRLAVRQLNDVVWNLDAHNDTVPNLLNRLRDYAHEVLVPTGRDVRFVSDESTGPSAELPPLVRRQLYLIYKEALHNILKHAPAAALVTVMLHRTRELLCLDVVNTGQPAPAGRSSGHGLRNMHERARTLGGTVVAEHLPEGGFAVRVRVPVG
jgi:signal transduction histidine kinase